MCGICGLLDFQSSLKKSILSKMNQSLVHRGPDAGGLFLRKNIGLASRRLSILDTHRGKQPIFNENKSCLIIYNGEVYNFQILRQDLRNKGHKFKTATDTEVILHLYEELGPGCVKKLRGMFAFAILDLRKNLIFLSRDHFGIKPLHYYFKNNLFLFGSEIKAITTHPRVKKELDFEALNQYFSCGFGCVPAPKTIFKNIKKLMPGHYLILKNIDSKKPRLRIKKYWHLEKVEKINPNLDEAKKKLRFLIEKSVKQQIIADKKVFGSFLSGGIDSSTVASLASQFMSSKIKTFSIGFKNSSFDESYFAKKVAALINSDHHHQYFSSKNLINIIPQLAKTMDEPFADSSLLPTYLLSTFTKKYVKVVFSGDGGDEIFGGYPTYQAHKIYAFYQKLPSLLRSKIIAPLINSLPTSFSNVSLDFKLKKLVSGDNLAPSTRHMVWLGPFSPKEKNTLLTPLFKKQLTSPDSTTVLYKKYFDQGKEFDSMNRFLYLDLKTYLGDFGLVKVDRASNLASLEVRPPLLNVEIAEFMASLPSHFKLKGLTTKYLLKQSVKDLLPKEIINRPKKGFGSPIASWISNELKPQIKDKLSEKRLKQQGLFKPQTVQTILKQHWAKKKDNRMKIWSLFMFQLWWDNFYK